MPNLDGFNKAVKHLDIEQVSKDTTTAPHKRDVIQKVRHVKKIQEYLQITNLVVEPEQSVLNKSLAAIILVHASSNTRILNYLRMKLSYREAVPLPWQPPLDLSTTEMVLDEETYLPNNSTLVVTVASVVDGSLKRYKLGPQKDVSFLFTIDDEGEAEATVQSDSSVAPLCIVQAPYYTGEKLAEDFILEFWYAGVTTYGFSAGKCLISNLLLKLSTLVKPTSIDDIGASLDYSVLQRSDFSVAFPGNFPLQFSRII